MISRVALLLKGKVLLAIVGTVIVAGGGTTIAVAATGAKVAIPLVSQASSSSGHETDSTAAAVTGSEGHDSSSRHDGQQAEGTVSKIDSSNSSFTLAPEHGAVLIVLVNAHTEFEEGLRDFSGLTVGLQIEVTGTQQTDGSLLATKVEAQDENANENENNEQDENKLNGTVMSIDAADSSFVLQLSDGTTKTIEVSSKTEFDGDGDFQAFSDLKVGVTVEVEGNLQSNGSIMATKVHREDNVSGNGSGSGSGGSDGGGTGGENASSTPTPSGGGH
jgi:hypothetical protein